ncbi:putative flippase GtrA [Anoxybacillus vitaminiphilus]|uniref:Putative flippase GtrA n=1 Tax=Paranoxybacillus vitaminiphilus TaxID=581036 RepID=A0A327YG96_9BACL|nr:GtrA family protein [Anoxybacillus vitaminiphilus]RAK19883.1 putative flippase GtrA [Anoxybacillus vitaminiphilus]
MLNGKEKISSLFRFCTVGVGNTLVDFGVFFLLTSIGVPYLLAQGGSYTAGMINSYIWNRVWTFQMKQKATIQEFFRFMISNLFSLGVTFFVLYVCQQILGWPLLISKMIATVGGMMMNFIGSRLWVFQE